MQTKIIIIVILVKKLSTTRNIYVIAYQLLQRPKTCDVHIQKDQKFKGGCSRNRRIITNLQRREKRSFEIDGVRIQTYSSNSGKPSRLEYSVQGGTSFRVERSRVVSPKRMSPGLDLHLLETSPHRSSSHFFLRIRLVS